MLILQTDKMSGLISYGYSYAMGIGKEKKEFKRLVFHVGITIQINGKTKTVFSEVSTISVEANNELGKELIVENDRYCFEDVSELRIKMETLTELGYGPLDYQEVRDKIREYVESFYKEFTE